MISERALRVLEYPKIMERLASHASFSLSKDRALALLPETSAHAVRDLHEQTAEAVHLLEDRITMTMGGAHDIRPSVTRAELGGVVDPVQLLDVQSTLECGERVLNTLSKLDPQVYPWLADQRHRMQGFRAISQQIAVSIDDHGEVRDGASPTLSRIRSELRQSQNRVTERLQQLMSGAFRMALQESLITMRNGRYVIPIKAEFRGQVKGIVHDQSTSGATVFIEPLQITELNNRWRQLQLDEADEIERILQEISGRIGAEAPRILSTVDALATIDLVLAKARYASAIRANAPQINNEREILLVEARHPLLTGNVVPITVSLGENFSILVITGPNTGGKTVALKTVGLLTLMAQAGLYLPTALGSRVAVFTGVYADIGDEQSIEQSLSTFSSHLTNIVSILAELNPQCLVLLDELGAGTDPTEGAALARAILTYLREHDVRAMATTHYSELKAFAYTEAGVENASVEFNVETLSPTYRLSIGLPGRSNALAIAARLGLPTPILQTARGYLTQSELQVETLLADIQRERKMVGELYAAAGQASATAHAMRNRLQQEVQSILAEKEVILANARAEAEASVEGLRQQLDRLEIEMRSSVQAPHVALASLKDRLDQAAASEKTLLPPRPPKPRKVVAAPSTRGIETGDRVEVVRLGQTGVVTSATEGKDDIEVQLGVLKTRVKRSELRLLGNEPPQDGQRGRQLAKPEGGVSITRTRDPNTSVEVDMRGWRADEVSVELDRYINDAYMSNLPFLRIIHGKGTGALRQVVRTELQSNPLVASFKTADSRDGGEGVTVVQLSST